MGFTRACSSQLPKIANATGEPPIVYAPRIAGTVEREMRRAGYTVTKTLDELEAAVRERMKPDERGVVAERCRRA